MCPLALTHRRRSACRDLHGFASEKAAQTTKGSDESMAEQENGKAGDKLDNKEYMKELRRFPAELCKLQKRLKYKVFVGKAHLGSPTIAVL